MFRTTCTAVLALAVLSSAAQAQSNEGVRIGLGVALNPIALADVDFQTSMLPIGLGNLTIPIRVGDNVRFEPELGIFRAHSESSSTGFSSKYTTSLLRYGLAVHYLFDGSGQFRPYVGPRFGFIRQSNDQESSGSTPTESHQTNTYFGVALGGEYWLSPRFSVGAEVQLNRVGIGDEEVSGQPAPSVNNDTSMISTNGVVAFKFYL